MREATISEMNLASAEMIMAERQLKERYSCHFAVGYSHINPDEVQKRKIEIHDEVLNCYPQNIFFIQTSFGCVVGRKLLSPLYENGMLYEPHCSRIYPDSVFGLLDSFHVDESLVSVSFYPFIDEERVGIIKYIAENPSVEIVFPFSYLDKGRERRSPKNGWSLDVERAENLGRGEENLRDFAIRYLQQCEGQFRTVYDPACSTGQFLYSIKQEFPSVSTVGQDLSSEMVEYARMRVDAVYHGDAECPAIAEKTADVAVCRFLNSEVVTSGQARILLKKVAQTVRVGGKLIVYGHTPVLVRRSDIESDGLFLVDCCTGSSTNKEYVFQFYVARRIK